MSTVELLQVVAAMLGVIAAFFFVVYRFRQMKSAEKTVRPIEINCVQSETIDGSQYVTIEITNRSNQPEEIYSAHVEARGAQSTREIWFLPPDNSGEDFSNLRTAEGEVIPPGRTIRAVYWEDYSHAELSGSSLVTYDNEEYFYEAGAEKISVIRTIEIRTSNGNANCKFEVPPNISRTPDETFIDGLYDD